MIPLTFHHRCLQDEEETVITQLSNIPDDVQKEGGMFGEQDRKTVD